MLTRYRSRTVLFLVTVFSAAPLFAQFVKLDWKMHNVGKVRQVITNMGTLDKGRTNFPGLIYSEFPPGSDEEHLYQGGLWIGAVTQTGDTLVSTTETHYTPHEFYPTSASWDTIWVASKGDTLPIPYWPNYVGLSDQDFICRYSDYNVLNIDNHAPLYLDVTQTSHAWSSPPVDEFIIFKYFIVPKKFPLKNVYIGFWMHSSIGNINASYNFIDEYTYYFPDHHMAVAEDVPYGDDGTAISPIGFKVLSPAHGGLKWSFKYYEHEELPSRDPELYREMSSGTIMPNRLDPARAHIIFGFGPFELDVNDTIKVEMAEVFGYGMKGLLKNADYLNFLKSKGFRVPSAPPRPIFRVATGNKEVRFDWRPLDDRTNPELYEDPSRGDTIRKPFEGYRLYKSTKGPNGPWTLLAEHDVIDDIGFNTGLQYEYRDVGLLNNVEYYYTLTAYSKPDAVINFPSQETSLSSNAKTVVPGVAPPQTVGEVAVVPNPYRGDIAYSSYNPPWERPQGTRPWWMEQDRRIQFINLPEQCEIKIYTLAGDLVNTLRHNDPNRGFEDWNLTSSVGQAIASGIYLFSVEDLKNGNVQVGKFVVLK
ncbi:MAG: hypothetical protein FJ217_04580 [Ignavibacteria bacterium]|nr:hypothetical protein [Ignavibacteria bacterium]